MGTRRAAKINAEVQEEQKCVETETKRLFDLLSKKLDTMNAHQERRHGEVCARIEALERSTSKLTSDIGSLKESCSKLEDELAGVKSAVEDKADMSKVLELERRIVDLQNRSRRNNVVIWNVPEGSEDGMLMTEFIQHLLNNHMKLEEAEAIEIMRVHRTPTTRNRDQLKSRPIHVYLLRYTDRQFILANAAKSLKDDVTKEIRDQRKLLKEEHLKTLRERADVEFAYVAWSIPARITYKGSISRESHPEVDGQNCLIFAIFFFLKGTWSRFWENRMKEFVPEDVRLFMCFCLCLCVFTNIIYLFCWVSVVGLHSFVYIYDLILLYRCLN